MILVVGHGQSSNVDPDWVDSQEFVVRILNTTKPHPPGGFHPHIGTKTDIIAVSRPRYMIDRDHLDFWNEGDYRAVCRKIADPYTNRKLSMGANGCLIAHHLYPDKDVGVIGFDAVMSGGELVYHDATGEGKLLRSIGVEDFGNYEDIRVEPS